MVHFSPLVDQAAGTLPLVDLLYWHGIDDGAHGSVPARLRRGPWLQDDDLGLPRSQGGVAVELLVVDGPPGPQEGPLVLIRGASADEA
jgi:hypothetical protein